LLSLKGKRKRGISKGGHELGPITGREGTGIWGRTKNLKWWKKKSEGETEIERLQKGCLGKKGRGGGGDQI